MPRGRVREVVAFYEQVIGLRELPKPPSLAARGGAWLDVDGYAQVHLSERDGDVHPDSHFAVVVDDMDQVLERLRSHGAEWTEQEDVFGGRRGFTRDPAGNRLEILENAGDVRR